MFNGFCYFALAYRALAWHERRPFLFPSRKSGTIPMLLVESSIDFVCQNDLKVKKRCCSLTLSRLLFRCCVMSVLTQSKQLRTFIPCLKMS